MSDTDMPRLLRLKQIIGDPKANPPIEAIIPISGIDRQPVKQNLL